MDIFRLTQKTFGRTIQEKPENVAIMHKIIDEYERVIVQNKEVIFSDKFIYRHVKQLLENINRNIKMEQRSIYRHIELMYSLDRFIFIENLCIIAKEYKKDKKV